MAKGKGNRRSGARGESRRTGMGRDAAAVLLAAFAVALLLALVS